MVRYDKKKVTCMRTGGSPKVSYDSQQTSNASNRSKLGVWGFLGLGRRWPDFRGGRTKVLRLESDIGDNLQKELLREIKDRSSQSELGMGVSGDGKSSESSFEAIGLCDEWLERGAHNLFKAEPSRSAHSAAGQLRA